MREVLDDVERWQAGGHRVALARVVGVVGSGPRGPGAAMAVNEDGEVAACDDRGEPGRRRIDISSDTTPNGTWMANSQGQLDTARIAAATEGPAADDVATTSTL